MSKGDMIKMDQDLDLASLPSLKQSLQNLFLVLAW